MGKELYHRKASKQAKDLIFGLGFNRGFAKRSDNPYIQAKKIIKEIRKGSPVIKTKDGDDDSLHWILERGRWNDDGIWMDEKYWKQ